MNNINDINDINDINAITRSWSHLNQYQFGKNIVEGFFIYNLVIHPLHMVLVYKRLEYSSLSTIQCYNLIKKKHGYKGFYRGFCISSFGLLFDELVQIPLIEYTREYGINNVTFESQIAKDSFGGFIGNIAAIPLYTPFNLISNRQMAAGLSDTHPYQNTYNSIKSIIKKDGAKGLFKGTGISLLYVPIYSLWWGIYGINKQYLYHMDRTQKDNIFINISAGGCASAITTIITNPLDVMITRVQSLNENKCKKRFIPLVKSILYTNGVKGFYRGFNLNICQKMIEGGFYGMIYDGVKKISEK